MAGCSSSSKSKKRGLNGNFTHLQMYWLTMAWQGGKESLRMLKMYIFIQFAMCHQKPISTEKYKDKKGIYKNEWNHKSYYGYTLLIHYLRVRQRSHVMLLLLLRNSHRITDWSWRRWEGDGWTSVTRLEFTQQYWISPEIDKNLILLLRYNVHCTSHMWASHCEH